MINGYYINSDGQVRKEVFHQRPTDWVIASRTLPNDRYFVMRRRKPVRWIAIAMVNVFEYKFRGSVFEHPDKDSVIAWASMRAVLAGD
jgi:hypothetical protein